ncbi:MAG: UDP-3-O-acyl-N-acetylglucosamine deacetylase [Alphaproteobacteria bacterium]|nr:UDP-3-O-acyl-N-acetylglucosamine deacetylase [Alphaproteobacteria bacterium]
MRQIDNNGARQQSTVKAPIGCSGIGLHSGRRIALRILPAPANAGLSLRRTDLERDNEIPLRWTQVVDTTLATTVGNKSGCRVGTVEHLMAALAGCEIDNAVIEVDGPEIPVFDGSAAPFVFLIECAGTVAQWAPRRAIKVLKSVAVFDGDKRMSLRPSNGFSVEFEIDFESPAIARQTLTVDVTTAAFKAEIARARTFGFAHEVERLKAAGLARGGSLENALVISDDQVLNEEGLRYADEFVRHKMLDCIGDLYLAGAPIIGRVQALRSGHNLNRRLLEALFGDEDAWCFVDAPAAERYASHAARHGWATPAAASA